MPRNVRNADDHHDVAEATQRPSKRPKIVDPSTTEISANGDSTHGSVHSSQKNSLEVEAVHREDNNTSQPADLYLDTVR